jgi:hypothetical protein
MEKCQTTRPRFDPDLPQDGIAVALLIAVSFHRTGFL